jgi:hypothetical protein
MEEALRTEPGSSLRLPKPSEKICQRACRVSAIEWMEESDIGKELGSRDMESTLNLAGMLP